MATTATGDKAARRRAAIVANGVTKAAGPRSQIDRNLVGVCVVEVKGMFFIRLSLRPHHMQVLGKSKIDIRGTMRDGLLLAPGKMFKPYKVSEHLLYVQFSLAQFEARIPKGARSLVWMRPTIEGGHIQLPGLPESWIRLDPEFQREVYHAEPQIFETGVRTQKLSPFPGDPAATTASETNRVEPAGKPEANGNGHVAPAPAPVSTQGITSPLPKQQQVPDYQVPGNLREMESLLASQIEMVRATIKAMEERTGLQFVLDRSLRVCVNLRSKAPDK